MLGESAISIDKHSVRRSTLSHESSNNIFKIVKIQLLLALVEGSGEQFSVVNVTGENLHSKYKTVNYAIAKQVIYKLV